MIDISGTIQAKSDQMNADDLIGNETIITVSNVTVNNSPDQPVVINYEGDNGKPFKPCLSMRKVLAALWGKDASVWIGRSMLLFNDPTVKWSGKEVGGIRISKVTDITGTKSVSMNQSKHKKTAFIIEPLTLQAPPAQQRPTWPDDKFSIQAPKIQKAIESGTNTAEKIITSLMAKADLTDQQVKTISGFVAKDQSDTDFFGEEQ